MKKQILSVLRALFALHWVVVLGCYIFLGGVLFLGFLFLSLIFFVCLEALLILCLMCLSLKFFYLLALQGQETTGCALQMHYKWKWPIHYDKCHYQVHKTLSLPCSVH